MQRLSAGIRRQMSLALINRDYALFMTGAFFSPSGPI